ncbi:hypothetical protein THAOC_10139 [Thalassiosira oceanica]|uniref:Reverse transcriptase Ty1/copia-type domain-containing protein n=1 Tax=Thalassiosira oceanica TaxID=159749 RepID=K0TDQ7_THAOC|nr:hypothetical protein THAOC_10139 [Thalassiosira oceanica]|eukprot:EJK68662.1 hypothetical protein THAOC_10139 [Thalassiosira oceanica]
MQFDFSAKGKAAISMGPYEEAIIEDFPEELEGYSEYPAAANLFEAPDEDDWKKLRKALLYLKRNPGLPLTLEASDLSLINWYVDASFAVHPDYKSHTGGMMTLGKSGRGAVMDICAKQRSNATSSTQTELYGVDQTMPKMIWAKHFLEAQGFESRTVLHQDNTSTIRLEVNGKKSSGQRTRHLHIKYFFVTDQLKEGWLSVQYCPTAEMNGDLNMKPLQGELWRKFMGCAQNCSPDLPPDAIHTIPACPPPSPGSLQECVGDTAMKKVSWADVVAGERI